MSDYNLKILLTANGETTTLDPVLGTPASVELSGLTADTEYEVEIILQSDGSNIDVASDTETFRTLSDIDENTPFYLQNLTENEATFTLSKNGTPTSTDLSYSLDNETWIEFDLTLTENAVKVPANGKIYLRSSTGFSNSTSNYFSLGMSQTNYRACGNIQYLLNYSDLSTELTEYCFHSLFYGSEYLIDASSLLLPATALAYGCYANMFYNCTSLTTAPELPATTLAYSCYANMFYNCTSLTTAPELPATTLYNYCYANMFYNCTSLTTAPELPATTLAYGCYSNMFNGCTSLTTAPELPVTTLANYCYDSMFRDCTNLTTAPKLPATTLAGSCYSNMFNGCTSLTAAPVLPATTVADSCYSNMFNGCTSLTTAPELPATTVVRYCYNGMFYGCTSLTTAPELPATTILAENCYKNMFYGCTNLQSVTTYCVNWSTSSANNWLTDAGTNAENPTIYCPANSTLKDYANNNNGIPTGWTQVDLPTE